MTNSEKTQITPIGNVDYADENHRQVLAELEKVAVCCVSTYAVSQIKNRMMHFAVSPEFEFYLSSLKTDPKIKQILLQSQVSLLAYIPGANFPEDKEIEITGYARLVPEEKKQDAVRFLLSRSPVVKSMVDSGNEQLLTFVEVVPSQVKFRWVKDILQGLAPTVLSFTHPLPWGSDWDKFKRKVKAWVVESRYPFLSVTILPALLGGVMAWAKQGTFNFFPFLLTFLGVLFLHLGTNIINDYFDHRSGNDEINTEFVRPFSGGSRVIQLGLLTPLEVLSGALLFFIFGSGLGLYLAFKFGWPVLFLGLFGVVSGFFYSAPFFYWVSRGIGELLVGLNFGVLVALGTYYVQTRVFSPAVFWASLPLGILVTAILWINEFPDYLADKRTGKNTLVVRLGREKASSVFAVVLMSSYLFLTLGVILGYLPKIVLLGLVSLPWAVRVVGRALKFHSRPFDLAEGNGLTIMCFNFLGIVLVLSYLWLAAKQYYFLPVLFLSLLYLWWNYNTIRRQKGAFEKIKGLV